MNGTEDPIGVFMQNKQTAFPVYPNFTITKRVCKGRFMVTRYVAFTSASILVLLLDENETIIDTRTYVLELPEFADWGSDDKFLVNWIKQKLTK